jgi:beta-glucuronidase
VVERRGGEVSVVKFDNGTWELQVGSNPYFVKGVIYVPVKIGESPDEGTMWDWMLYDDKHTKKNEMAYETWLYNDPKHKPVGDFQLMKDMGVNTIRLYHEASDSPLLGDIYKAGDGVTLQFDHPINKPLLRELARNYGIRIIMGNFLGSWTIGSGATWDEGTDYTNPVHCENIRKSVRAMVLDNKDEPYVLMWMLGNENNTADFSHCNAKTHPDAYAKLIGELVAMIHQLDPNHPVSTCDGDDNFRMLRYYAKYAPTIDIIGYNAYRGPWGFGSLWNGAKQILDRPILISEYGAFAYVKPKGEDEDYQMNYIKGCWKDIASQSAMLFDPEKNRIGNSIGGTIVDWVDRWYMSGTPWEHSVGTKPHWNSPDHLFHEE